MTPELGNLAGTRESTDERRVMARSLAYLWLAGATMVALTVALPHDPGASEAGLLAVAATAYVAAGVMAGVRGLPAWAFELIQALGGVLVGCALVSSGSSATSSYALFMFWISVHACYFLPWRRAVPQLVWLATVFTVVQFASSSPDDERAVRIAMVIGTLVVIAAFVGLLKARVDRLLLRLAEAARRDFLTGLLNRRGFEDVLGAELERVHRQPRAMSLLLADLDHFKQVNDRFGHEVGDATLRRVARVFDGTRRRYDTAARTGGEEFALLLPDTDADDAFVVAERLCDAIRAATGEHPPRVTISVGLATFPADGWDARELVRAADEALYAAKGRGRDRVVAHSPDLAGVIAQVEDPAGARAPMELSTAIALAHALDLRDGGTARHSRAVGRYAQLTALELGLSPERAERVRLAGELHDIGKIGVPDALLHKPGPLDPDEWEQMRTHPEIAARLLTGDDVSDIRSWVLAHHERPDGRGYPFGIAADAIPFEARILAAADAFEAMTSDRVYRSAIGLDAAAAELRRGAGTQFDPRAVEALLAVIEHAPAESAR
jgi:diguanylate cyclase (GGDEF)-like protein